MSKEVLPLSKKIAKQKRFLMAARVAVVGLPLAVLSCASSPANTSVGEFQKIASPPPITLTAENKSEQLSDMLDNDYARAGLTVALGMAIGMSVSAYYLGKRHDETALRTLRIAGPLTMIGGASTGLIDSFATVNNYIPSSLFLTSALLIAGHQVINTFEHYKDPKIRAGALLAAAGLTSLGVIAFTAFT